MIVSWHRKYRPKRVEDLDQERVRNYFSSLLKSGKFTQAYLFTGPKGTGKTTAARLLALILNCETNAKAVQQGTSLKDPCGACDVCQSILEGGSSCVLEMDAASNRGIDDIRQLRERVNLMPSQGNFSVYIIDEVHMLTTEAFNALLKTLEEPPAHVVFCLCTTEEHKLPATIVSRCTRIEYGLSSETEIRRSLQRVVEGEKLVVNDEVLDRITVLGEGSFRDAVKYLEQLALAHDEITIEVLDQAFNAGSTQVAETVLSFLESGQLKEALALVQELDTQGGKLDDLGRRIVQLALNSVRTQVSEGKPVDQAKLQLIEIFSKAFTRFSQVPIASLPLEMAIVEFGLYLGTLKQTTEPKMTTAPVVEPVQVSKPQPEKNTKKIETKPKPVSTPKVEVVEVQSSSASNLKLTTELVNQNWQTFLKSVEKQNHAIGTVLRGAHILSCQGNCIELEVAYSFHKRQLEQDRYLRLIDTSSIEIFGDRIVFLVKLGKSERIPKGLQEHNNVSPSVKSEDEALISAVEDAFGV